MCGICGALGKNNRDIILRMNNAISYRGPDEKIIVQSEDCLLGMSRLKIKGDSRSVNKFFFLNQTIEVVFNGEIYNYQAIKNQLRSEGFVLETGLELELIALLYALYGEEFILKLDGMFAIALRTNKKLFLYRDRLGIKPIYYALGTKGDFYFGSEIKSILAAKIFSPEVNTDFIEDVLTFGFSLSKTNSPFKKIYQIPPGSYMVASNNSLIKKRYYVFQEKIDCVSPGYHPTQHNIKTLFDNAIEKMFTHDDQDKGICLSGGFDSSLIALLAAEKTNKKLYTYTLTSENNNNLEDVIYASRVSQKIGSKHKLIKIGLEEVLRNLVHFTYHYESIDFGGVFDPNGGLAFHILLEYAAKDAKVVFSGEGADELYCGYGKLHGQPGAFIQKLKTRIMKIRGGGNRVGRKFDLMFPANCSEDFYKNKVYNLLLGPGLYNYHLQCVDRSSSSYGAELRPVFLDTDFFEYSKRLSPDLKINEHKTKIILRDAFAPYLKKHGLGDIVIRKKLAMPTALESLEKSFSEKITEINKKAERFSRGPYDHLFINDEEKLLFDLFHFLFITKAGCTDYGKIPLEEIAYEREFRSMYN